MVEHLPIGAAAIDGEVIFLNAHAERLSGYTNEEIGTLSTWFEKLYRERAAVVTKLYQQDRAARFGKRSIVPLIHKDGSLRHVEFSASFSGQFEIWILNDVTERFASEEKFRVLFETSTDGYILFNRGGDGMIDCNPAAVTMLGFHDKASLLSRHPAEFSPEYQPDGRRSEEKSIEMDRLAREKGMHRFEWTHRKADGTDFPVEVTLNRVMVGGKDVLLAVWHDLTEQKKAQIQTLYTSKMVSLGEMAEGMAHEINNPLAIIKGRTLQLLSLIDKHSAAGVSADANASAGAQQIDWQILRKHLVQINHSSDRIAKVITGLNQFARDVSTDPFTKCQAQQIVADTLRLCESRLRAQDIELQVEFLEQAELTLECRPAEISQALLSLLNNAYDAVAPGSPHAPETQWIRIEVYPDQDGLACAVSDSGPGVPLQIRHKLMQPFFTTKGAGKGTGLGLSISQGFVRHHRGRLYLDESSSSTRFVMWLPCKILDPQT